MTEIIDVIEQNFEVEMIRPHLDDLPDYPVPAPYQLRWYQAGDEAAWLAIHQAADLYNTFDQGSFAKQFGVELKPLVERQAYLVDGQGKVIGTASAWFGGRDLEPVWGRVHWIAIMPEAQGRGLGKPLLGLVCHRMRELGYTKAILGTSTARVPAINLYQKFGFIPKIRHEEDRQVWQAMNAHLKAPFQIE